MPTPEEMIAQLQHENTQLRAWLQEAQAAYRQLSEQMSALNSSLRPTPWQNLSDAARELTSSRIVLVDRVRQLEADLALAKAKVRGAQAQLELDAGCRS